MRVRIEIDTKTFVRFWLVVIGFAFAILAIYLAQTALIMIGTADKPSPVEPKNTDVEAFNTHW